MIVVTGATGRLGRRIVAGLLAALPPERIGASVRDPAKAADLAARGVRVRAGDFGDPEGLRFAFEGADRVLLVSSNSGADGPAQHRNAVEAAKAAGVARIVYTSHMGADPGSPFPPMRSHAATEAMLAGAGIAFTALRNGYYAASALAMLGDARKTGVVALPEDGPVAWTAHDNLAAAAVAVLTDGARHRGATPPLTGPEALDFDGIAAVLAAAWGRDVRRETVPDAAYRDRLVAGGLPEAQAERALGFFRAARAGAFAAVDPALGRLLGRPPAPFGAAVSTPA